MSAKRCVFCGGRPVTEEHVLPRWLRGILPMPDGPQILATINHELEPRINEVRTRRGPLVVKRVCRPCNNGWMEADNQLVRGLIEGVPMTLSVEEQRRVALWAVTTVMMFEFTGMPRVISAAHHHWLYRHREPPPGTAVWITRNNASADWYRRTRHGAGSLFDAGAQVTDVTELQTRYIYSTALGLGKVFMLVLGTDAPLNLVPFVRDNLPRVWPVAARLAFPSGPVVSPVEADRLAMLSFVIPMRLGAAGPIPVLGATTGRP